ncbi:MAG: HIT domain-containing protein [Kangiellaceae bacterium]|jgi:diadenosine tetraphosphate (Ap4A) HIT family hydrolase
MEFQLDKTLKADSLLMGHFKLSYLLLMNDSNYPWFTLVPRRPEMTEIYQLCEEDQKLLWQESKILSRVIMDYFSGEKLNIAAIGNIVSQLHMHHVVRFKHDVSWPKPIWGQLPMSRYADDNARSIMSAISERLELEGFCTLD